MNLIFKEWIHVLAHMLVGSSLIQTTVKPTLIMAKRTWSFEEVMGLIDKFISH